MYQELVEYHQAHGDCNVPRYYSENPQLSTWVSGQRQRNNRGNLDAEKIEKLDELGFSWNPYQDAWNEMYQTLVEYKRAHGHCRVANDDPQYSTLITWITNQRHLKKVGKMKSQRLSLLEKIGFA